MTTNCLAKPMDAVWMSLFLSKSHSDLHSQVLGGDGAAQIEKDVVTNTCTSPEAAALLRRAHLQHTLTQVCPKSVPTRDLYPGSPFTFSVLLMMVCRGSSSLLSAVCVLYTRTAGMLEAGMLCCRLQRWSSCLCRHAAPFAKDKSEDISIHIITSPATTGALLRGHT